MKNTTRHDVNIFTQVASLNTAILPPIMMVAMLNTVLVVKISNTSINQEFTSWSSVLVSGQCSGIIRLRIM